MILVSYAGLAVFAALNLLRPGMGILFVGVLLNAIPIAVDRGMPVEKHAIVAARVADAAEVPLLNFGNKRHLAGPGDDLRFLDDRLPDWVSHQVLSVGDLVITVGVAAIIAGLLDDPRALGTRLAGTRRVRPTHPSPRPPRPGRRGPGPSPSGRRRPNGPEMIGAAADARRGTQSARASVGRTSAGRASVRRTCVRRTPSARTRVRRPVPEDRRRPPGAGQLRCRPRAMSQVRADVAVGRVDPGADHVGVVGPSRRSGPAVARRLRCGVEPGGLVQPSVQCLQRGLHGGALRRLR